MTDGLSVLDQDTAAQWDQYRASRDQSLRNALTERYLPLARSIAASVFKARIDDSVAFDDFLQYARMGLMQAIERFDPTRGIAFEAFAARRVRGTSRNSLSRGSEVAAAIHRDTHGRPRRLPARTEQHLRRAA